jgi:DNA-binding transcriptional LysR family regulator
MHVTHPWNTISAMRDRWMNTEIDLPSLHALRHLLATESVTLAARRLGVTQPAMSRTLARLRKHFRDPLLVAVGRHLERTSYARELEPHLEEALSAVDRLFEARPSFTPEGDRFTMRIAASDYATAVVIRPWIARLRVDAPNIAVRIDSIGVESIDPLARGELDLAIGPRVPIEGIDQLVFRKLLDDRLVCAVREGHPEAHRRLTLARYLALDHIVVSTARPGVSALQLALHRIGKTRRVVASVPTFFSALALISATDLAAALPETLVAASAMPLVSRPLPFDVEPMTLHAIWHPRSTSDPRHRWLREHLADSIVPKGARAPRTPPHPSR